MTKSYHTSLNPSAAFVGQIANLRPIVNRPFWLFFLILFLALSIPLAAADVPAVKVWETTMVIPTYLAGDPEPNPMFYFGRQSQGAQAPVGSIERDLYQELAAEEREHVALLTTEYERWKAGKAGLL